MTVIDTQTAQLESSRYGMRTIPVGQPLDWLTRGWHDFIRCPLPGLLHGAAMALFGAVLFAAARDRFWLLAGAFSGFLLVAPLIATGLYAISRDLERGRRPTLATAVHAWHPGRNGRLVAFGILLALAGTGWVLTSASMITALSPVPIRSPADFLQHIVLAPDSWLFEAWLVLGALLAAPVFASSVVAIPLLLDRDVHLLGAVFISWRTVLEDPAPLALWAFLLMLLTLLGMASALIGLVIIAPWLGHASWHAYRDLVEPADDRS